MSDAPPTDPTMYGWLYSGGGLLAVGAGLRFVWEKIAKRAATREARLEARESEYALKLERRVAELETNDLKRARENIGLRIAFEILAAEIRRSNPTSPELKRAEMILNRAYDVPLETPADMLAAIARIDSAAG